MTPAIHHQTELLNVKKAIYNILFSIYVYFVQISNPNRKPRKKKKKKNFIQKFMEFSKYWKKVTSVMGVLITLRQDETVTKWKKYYIYWMWWCDIGYSMGLRTK